MTGLLELLGVGRGHVVAAVGAGGKTTLLRRLASEACDQGLRVILTTTTHMGTLPEGAGPTFVLSDGEPGAALDEALRRHGRATVFGRRVRPDKLAGIPPARVDALAPRADLVLVEADGARGRSLKVPADHEPVVPLSATLVLVLAALDVLEAPLTEERVHRLEAVARVTGRGAGQPVDEDAVAAALAWRDGYLARFPGSARRGVVLNKAEDPATRASAARLAARLVPPYAFVAAGSARSGRLERWP